AVDRIYGLVRPERDKASLSSTGPKGPNNWRRIRGSKEPLFHVHETNADEPNTTEAWSCELKPERVLVHPDIRKQLVRYRFGFPKVESVTTFKGRISFGIGLGHCGFNSRDAEIRGSHGIDCLLCDLGCSRAANALERTHNNRRILVGGIDKELRVPAVVYFPRVCAYYCEFSPAN